MSEIRFVSSVLVAFAMAPVGLVTGLLYFHALRRTVDAIAARGGWLRPAGQTLVRIIGVAVVLILMVRLGPAPLLAGFFGFLLARAIALRLAQGTP
jgi:dipeptide/tripeptide permease